MPNNSKDYQRSYRNKTKDTRKVVSVAMPMDDHQSIARFAQDHGLSVSAALREATLCQQRNVQLQNP